MNIENLSDFPDKWVWKQSHWSILWWLAMHSTFLPTLCRNGVNTGYRLKGQHGRMIWSQQDAERKRMSSSMGKKPLQEQRREVNKVLLTRELVLGEEKIPMAILEKKGGNTDRCFHMKK